MICVAIDFESTGLDISTARITEVGMVKFRVPDYKIISMQSFLINPLTETLKPEIEDLTGITNEMVSVHGLSSPVALFDIEEFCKNASYIVAHNGNNYDKPLLLSEINRHNFSENREANVFEVTPWLDTSIDVPYPPGITTRKLVHLCCDHGFLNPFPHRALSDAMSCYKLLSHYDFNQVVEFSKSPTLKVLAIIEKPWFDNGEGKKKAFDAGFRWNGELKRWQKVIKEVNYEKECGSYGFEVEVTKI